MTDKSLYYQLPSFDSLKDERHHLKEELMEHLDHAYHGDVMGVYFTEFVTQ